MDKYIGKKLEGRYEILELIGFGGMAVVFKAFDILENRYVAVKILKDEYLQNEDFKRRFRNESKAIALLSHPNIVKIFDVNFSDNIQYIVMEYIDGITLKEYIEQQGVVKWKEAIHFTVQILRALQHAHDNGIVHRDVKPQNIMLLEDGTIKVMDFGIARFARENGKTMSDKAIGSVHYISPEQAKGDATDEKTDIYAVGVILYEMLTGKVPFDGDTPVSIAIKQMQIEPVRPTDRNPDIPAGLEEIVLRAMQKDPQLRYSTAAEMLRDIDEFKHNPDVVFEYKYFNSDGTTKYFNKIDSNTRLPEEAEVARPKKKKSYVMNILAGVAAACVILAAVALYFFFKSLGNKTQDVALPTLIGITIDDARAKYPDFKITVEKQEPSTEYDKNVITDQTPDAGIRVKANSEVLVTISTGMEAITVPDLKGETASAAKAKLAGLDIEEVLKANDDVEAGRVFMTDPGEGTQLKKGDKIVLYISLGTPDMPATVPQLIGRTQVEATSELLKANLNVGKVESVPSNEPKGTVVGQSEDFGTRVEKGTKIDLQISNGIPASSDIPISIKFPTLSANYDYIFDIYVNGEQIDSRTFNPFVNGTMSLSFTLEDGLINGIATANTDSLNEVTIRCDGSLFAEYTLDFKTNSVATVTAPDFTLIAVMSDI